MHHGWISCQMVLYLLHDHCLCPYSDGLWESQRRTEPLAQFQQHTIQKPAPAPRAQMARPISIPPALPGQVSVQQHDIFKSKRLPRHRLSHTMYFHKTVFAFSKAITSINLIQLVMLKTILLRLHFSSERSHRTSTPVMPFFGN